MNKKLNDIQDTLLTIDDLLHCLFISAPTRMQLERFKADLNAERRFILGEKSELRAAAS